MSDDRRSSLMHQLDALGVWNVHTPAPTFADDVLAATDTAADAPAPTPARIRPWSRKRWGYAALGASAAVVLAALLTTDAPSPSGSRTAVQRETVSLTERSVVVAEPGTSLSWSRRGAALTVNQSSGHAFYRVEPDDAPFEVHTPAADIQVTGTCFDVHLEEVTMPTNTRHLALGAALATAVTVTVYEGSTVLANDEGQVRLGAGERGVAEPGTTPYKEPSTSDSADPTASERELLALRAEHRRQTVELEALRARVDREGSSAPPRQPDQPEDPSTAERSRFSPMGPPIPEGFSHYQPTPEALIEMAECGIVAWDQPPVWADDVQPDPEYLDALDLDPEERAAFVETFDEFRAESIATARAFYVELGGTPAVAEAIDPSELVGLVYGKTDLDSREESRIAMAMERAGLAHAPARDLTSVERFMRWDAELGNAFERTLAESLGAERARDLRDMQRGWSGKRTTWADLCTGRK